jgi:hypothetical protein
MGLKPDRMIEGRENVLQLLKVREEGELKPLDALKRLREEIERTFTLTARHL